MQFEIGLLILGLVIIFFIVWLLGSFFLWLALKMIDVPEEKRSFGSVMITALLNGLVSAFIPFIGCIIAWWIIKARHTDTWGKAIAAWILSIVLPIIIGIGIIIIAGIPFLFMPTGP